MMTKTRARVKEFGEVFTSKREVLAIIELIPNIGEIGNKILEPSCGNGNFVIEIFNNKIIDILNDIHATDILEDNINETKNRILKLIEEKQKELDLQDLKKDKLLQILNKNIILSDFLKNYKKYINFHAVIGNPPYQKEDNGYGASATPLYNEFIG